MGIGVHAIPVSGLSFEGTAEHDSSLKYTLTGDQASRGATAVSGTFDIRLTASIGKHFYLGSESSIGGISFRGKPVRADEGRLVLKPVMATMVTSGAVFGMGLDVSQNWRLKGEIGVGVRLISLTIDSTHLQCEDQSFASSTTGYVRPAVALERWLGPFMSVGASVGSDLALRGDVSTQLYLQAHFRAFDGIRGRR